MRHGLIGIAAAVALLAASGAAAQVSYGVAKTPGVTFHAPPPSPPPSPAPPPSHSPRGHGRPGMPQSGGDLFLAGPHTYSPRAIRSRLRQHVYVSPYALPAPYFLPGDYPVGVASAVSTYSSPIPYAPIDAGYLVLRMEPRTAMVYVDGFFMGSAEEGRVQGYQLEPGPHRVELRAEGFETAAFDVRVRANDTITYTKDLERPAPATPRLEPVVVAQIAAPKTLYVIPRCYAGDRRPDASDLPAHCDLADLRVIR